jgi:hypothetical protein
VTFHVSTLDYSALPEWAREGLRLYVEEHVEPGSGLRACLQNDLREAIGRVWQRTPESAQDLCLVVSWLYNEAPGPCWGSKDKVVAWLLGARTV